MAELKKEISEIEYNRYIKQLRYDEERSKKDHVVFTTTNMLLANYIKTKYAATLAHLFEISTGVKPEITIGTKNGRKNTRSKTKKSENKTPQSLLNPSYTFENFVEGGSNEFAVKASKMVVKKPGTAYNPLLIYGGVGLGKTHLMQAIGNALQAKHKTVIYTSVEQFLNDFRRHIDNNTIHNFKDKYRKCDLLLVDDIQFLSNKKQTQEEFFYTFEALYNDGKQIVLTADKHPKQIAGLEERLQSRFEWGLIVDIQPPELETKIQIIKKKCEINRIKLPNDVINYIATVIESNTREIEGIIIKLNAFANFTNAEIDLTFTKNILKENLHEKKQNISLNNIIDTVAKDFNVKKSEICSKGRARNVLAARRVAIYLSRELTTNTMPQLAKQFGMKDHTAISHTMKKINELIESDEEFKLKIEELHNKITTLSS